RYKARGKGRARGLNCPGDIFRRDFLGNSRRWIFLRREGEKRPGKPDLCNVSGKRRHAGPAAMTQPFDSAGDGLPASPAPDTTVAGSHAASGTGPGVPLSIWPGLPDPGGAGDGLPCAGPVTTAVARRVI